MTTTSDAAREQARNTRNGRFGEQHLDDPGAGVLGERTMTRDQAFNWLHGDNFTITPDRATAAFRAAGIPDGTPVTYPQVEAAKEWLRIQAHIDSETRSLDRELDAMRAAKRRAGTVAVKCAALRIRQLHPGTLANIRLRRGDADRVYWDAFDSDGHPLPIRDDFHEALTEYDPVIDFTDTPFVHGLATGRRWDGNPPAGVEFDEHGHTVAIEVNWRCL